MQVAGSFCSLAMSLSQFIIPNYLWSLGVIFWLVFSGWVCLLKKFQALVSKPLLKGNSPIRVIPSVRGSVTK